MGYYTDYDISDNSEEVQQRIKEVSDYDYFNEIKWYGHDKDMKQISIEFFDTLLYLSGKGEDGEKWESYYKNGKMFTAMAITTFEPFEESKLV